MKTEIGYVAPARRQFTDLPVELLEEIYLVALSPSFPHLCRYIYNVVKSFPASIHAKYIFGRHPPGLYFSCPGDEPAYIVGPYVTRALRYPICTLPVLDAMLRIPSCTSNWHFDPIDWESFELPKRIFRSLGESDVALGPDSEPLPILRFLWHQPKLNLAFPQPLANSQNGYPLVRAVHARFTPLIRFLLDHGADPGCRECMAIKVAIGKKDMALVKMLIEVEPEAKRGGAKRRRRADRVAVKPFMLDLAVKCDARDIVQYFMQEKGCVPHMKTLRAI